MRKVSALLFTLTLTLLLSGCKNSSENTAYDQVGDMRVFEEPRREVTLRSSSGLWNESVPAPKPMATQNATHKKMLSRQYTTVGDLELE